MNDREKLREEYGTQYNINWKNLCNIGSYTEWLEDKVIEWQGKANAYNKASGEIIKKLNIDKKELREENKNLLEVIANQEKGRWEVD
jgi:hypothetical protein